MKYWISGAVAAFFVPVFLFFMANNVKVDVPADDGYPKPLANPPAEIRALYATSWSASSQEKMNYLIDLVSSTAANAIVVDIKDYSGIISYSSSSSLPLAEKYGALTNRIKDINPFVENMHRHNVYLIGRITVFQDPILAEARPDLAVKDFSGAVWKDNKGLSWLDPANQEVWDYHLAIAKDLFKRGFDEVNFDYVRFPSDGQDVDDLVFPAWDKAISKREVIRSFFQYLRESLPDKKISVDIFGQTTVASDDFGIGQMIEDAYRYFDYVAPMVYPSHFINGFIGYANPAEHPYEVIHYSMEEAAKRLMAYRQGQIAATSTIGNLQFASSTRLRPWLQAFDLGAVYTPEMIRKQIEAVNEVKSRYPETFDGYFLWSPKNNYPAAALLEYNVGMGNLILKSVFRNKEFIPAKYSCDGDNINPLLEIRNVPEAAKGLVLIMDDPDAPGLPADQKAWDHWIVWNINPKSQYIPEGELPEGARVGKNTRGKTVYGGPCPPVGHKAHRYFFKLYALDALLDLPDGSTKKELEAAMVSHILEQTALIGMYQRKK